MNPVDQIPNLQPKVSTPTPSVSTTPNSTQNKKINILPIILVIIFGIGTGILVKQLLPKSSSAVSLVSGKVQSEIPTTGVKVGDIYGNPDAKSFKDSATGVLDKGGLNGEGTHKLLRSGGESQTAYLTSSVVDLDEFVGHQITVWGDTFSGRKAGWLMDVGRVKVDALNASAPTE